VPAPITVVHVSSEVAPWAQTGGLADVTAALPAALAAGGDVRGAIVVPLYRAAARKLAADGVALVASAPRVIQVGPHAIDARILRADGPGGVAIGWVDAPALYDRDGLYGPGGIGEFGDNHIRYAALSRIAVEAGAELVGGPVDVIHAHDWQGALAPAYARLDPALAAGMARAAMVTTIHNLAFRGLYPVHTVPELGLPWSAYDHHHAEFWGQLSLLKAGLAYSDTVTTVSPSYAAEILTPALGEGLDGFLAHDVGRLVGIENGIDAAAWDPARDPALPRPYGAAQLDGKAACRAAVAAEVGLAVDDGTLLAGVVARMSWQKGLDLVADVVPALHALGVKLIVLGSGDPALEDRLRYLATAFADTVAVRIGFDAGLARRIYAGADAFLMPSRFEPCGLGQLYAMRYGTPPIVHAVGGLRDTVDDGETGFAFGAADPVALEQAIARAAAVFATDQDAWREMVVAAMRRDSSWAGPARAYVDVYRDAIARRRG
jgi:starch synthase